MGLEAGRELERLRVGEVDLDEGGRCSEGVDVDVGFRGRAAKARDGEILENRLPKVEKKRSKPSSDGLVTGLALAGVLSSSGIVSAATE